MTTPTSYSPTTWIDTSSGGTPLSAANLNKIEQAIVSAYVRANQMATNPTIIRTGAFTLSYNDFGRFDCSAQSLVSTLPPAQIGAIVGFKKTDATANTATFNPAGTDTIDGNATGLVLRLQNECRTLVGITGGWVVVNGLNTIATLDLRYGTLAAQTALQTPPVFYATQSAQQTLANNTVVALTWPTEVIDTANGHSTSTNTSRYVCQQAGWYYVSGVVNFATQNTTGVRSAFFYKNGAEYPGGQASVNPTAAQTRVATPSVLMNFALNDYVELMSYHNAGVTTTTEGTATTGSSLSVVFIRS